MKDSNLESELLEIARLAFLKYYRGRTIAPEIGARLTRSWGLEGEELMVSIVLHSELGEAGLTRDQLEPPGRVIVRLTVDIQTRGVGIEEFQPIPW